MEEEKESHKFIKVLTILFISFLIMYISKEKGLYEIKTYNKTPGNDEGQGSLA